jgi:ComF family protein
MKYLDYFWDIVFPKKCINCKKEGTYLCEDCFSLIEINPFQYCLCEKLKKMDKCDNCKNKSLDKILSAASFNNKILKRAIYKLKYDYIEDMAQPMALLVLTHLYLMEEKIDKSFIVIPVPLSPKKKRRRGFNQSEKIGKIITETTNLDLCLDGLFKIKENKPQMELNKKERTKNIKNCFRAEKEKIEGKNILLLDDVYTTGSTMEECAKTLKQSGAKKVWGLTIAREVDQQDYFV